MKSKNNKKKVVLLVVSGALIIAGLTDFKYKGLFFQLLPKKLQTYIERTL